MKSLLPLLLIASLSCSLSAALVQTFESGEDTSNWGSDWVAPGGWTTSNTPFLDPSLGGSSIGAGSTADGQNAHRDFSSNTAGLDTVNGSYTTSMYLNITSFGQSIPDGSFYVIDGDYDQGGSANVVQLRIIGSNNQWEYFDYNGTWTSTGVSWSLGDINYIEYSIDNTNQSYNFTISEVDSFGAVVNNNTTSISGIKSGTPNSNQKGTLTYHFETSGGTAVFGVDNINIAVVPELSSILCTSLAMAGLVLSKWIKQRR
ncbi:hypothetical protein P0Y35_06750 [Kiritimatiellaeota bacterium B1221]|nr:hypothetical protein [Kiritimatiellaeota bacterium B1221]